MVSRTYVLESPYCIASDGLNWRPWIHRLPIDYKENHAHEYRHYHFMKKRFTFKRVVGFTFTGGIQLEKLAHAFHGKVALGIGCLVHHTVR